MKDNISLPHAYDSDVRPDGESVLSWLERRKVFALSRANDGSFLMEERCDGYYDAPLSKADLLQLADEIKSFAEAQ